MSRLTIQGGRPLSGTFKPTGNKNAALPMLAAALLTDEEVVLRNVPCIEDVHVMLDLLSHLGVRVERKGDSCRLCAAGVNQHVLDAELCKKVRSSILLAAPLAARHGKATLYPPGGDVIGRRRLDTHFLGLRSLGMDIDGTSPFTLIRRNLQGTYILLDEASVTATENVLMAATLAEGETTIFNAACEPHVQDLGRLLQKMGADIDGVGTNCLVVRGTQSLGGAEHSVIPDHIEVASFLTAAAVTGGEIKVEQPGSARHLQVLERAFRKLGIQWSLEDGGLVLSREQPRAVVHDFDGSVPKIEDGVWPMFPSDLMSVVIVLATQVSGTVLFFEKLFESRMYFVDNLLSMGAEIIQCDPHRVVVVGPSRLRANHMTSPDIRAGMALVVAALCAEGTSVIENAQIIDRGYECIDERLRALGADVSRSG